ncbi:hypothetical protein GDO86_000897 [Hymenochirus boettgeri]|uniref:SH2 domain-containing protein n=1 Tax=Hymenochirus boettgeri TaxID=247094 RepID=A0A8T2KAE7_9PIPI|nr:hypothetical protein GDO86_000897 [Hymenochirus boettgeri]
MARWLKDYLNFKKSPPKPPKPDYTESEILRAYRAQKSLDFEDPYQDHNAGNEGSQDRILGLQVNIMSPRHRLIKVEPAQSGRIIQTQIETSPGSKCLESFDAKIEDYFGSTEPADTSYKEQYEPKSRQAGLHNIHQKDFDTELQLYDSPYQEQCQKTVEDCHQPPEDERPADEYDQPWEWKKDDINRAFAVQFDGTDWENSSFNKAERLVHPSSKTFRHLQQNSPSSCHEITVCTKQYGAATCEDNNIVEKHGTFRLPLHTQLWNHGTLTQHEAENCLQHCRPGSFLLRTEQESENFLSVIGNHNILHLKVKSTQDGSFMLEESGQSFPCIHELVQHYMKYPLILQDGKQLFLHCPAKISR